MALPRLGTFWVMTAGSNGHLMALPYPTLPANLSALPIYSVAGNIFMVDDTGGQLASSSARRMNSVQAASTLQAQVQTVAGLIERIQMAGSDENNQSFQPNGVTSMIDTNRLWLEASNEVTSLGLRLHNTVGGNNYQLLSTPDLTRGYWDLGEILFYASDGQADFSPIPMTNAMTFFWAHHANPVMWIVNGQDSEELNPTNTSDPGHGGIIYIFDEGWATNDVTVYYSIGGTARNGIDYSNLTGVATVPVNQGYAEIDIEPTADGLKPDQTIILTLIQNTNYLIDPSYYSATNTLLANPEVYPTAHGDIQRPCPNTSWPIYLRADDPRNLPLSYIILTYPVHGTLSGTPPYMTYTPTNCYEGQDSFTFKVSDGQYDSAPATVTLIISDPVYANPISVQTCRGRPVGVALSGWDNCGETLGYAVSTPQHGALSGTAPNLAYTPTGTNFTGLDIFNYVVFNGCGDAATSTVTITVDNTHIYPNDLSVLTGTNQAVAITLSAADYNESCTADTNYYTYTVANGPTNGFLSGTPPHLTYTPTNGESMDSFQFTVHDGVWPGLYPGTVKIYAVAGPSLTAENAACYQFGSAVQLDWSLDAAVLQMQQEGLMISDFVIHRSTNSGGPYTPIYTTQNGGQMSYLDVNAVPNQTNYYVVTFETSQSGVTYASPGSNVAAVMGLDRGYFVPANAVWDVVTNLDDPTNVVKLQAPFSSEYPNQYFDRYPLPNSYWPAETIRSNHIAMFIATNSVDLSRVKYSIAIDNDYWLYVNNSTGYIGMTNNSEAYWPGLQSFPTNALHYGTNDIVVVIRDDAEPDYFSMVVTTNTCGW